MRSTDSTTPSATACPSRPAPTARRPTSRSSAWRPPSGRERVRRRENPLLHRRGDLRYRAEALEGEVTQETLLKHRYGSGMIVHMPKGRGEVVHRRELANG